MASRPIALVIGATGSQGGSVAAALADKYHIRTLSRDPEKPAAKAAAAKGYEVLKGSIGDSAAVRSALAGAEVVFLVTQYWEQMSKEQEFRDGKVFVDEVVAAAKSRPIKFVASTLENVTRVTGGRITKVAHFDGKGELEEYIQKQGIPHVFIHMAAYLENFLGGLKPRPAGDGSYAINLPDMGGKPLNVVAAAEVGSFVRPIVDHYDRYVGKAIPIVSDLIPVNKLVEDLAAGTGVPIKFSPMTYEAYAKLGYPGAEDMSEMFRFYADGPIDRSTGLAKELNPKAHTTRQWAAANREKLLAAWGISS